MDVMNRDETLEFLSQQDLGNLISQNETLIF